MSQLASAIALYQKHFHHLCVLCIQNKSINARIYQKKDRQPWPIGNKNGTYAHRSCIMGWKWRHPDWKDLVQKNSICLSPPSPTAIESSSSSLNGLDLLALTANQLSTRETVPPSLDATPLSELASDLPLMFQTYGYALIRSTRRSVAFARTVRSLAEREGASLPRSQISGNVLSVDFDNLPAFNELVRTEWRAVVDAACRQLGLNIDSTYNLLEPRFLIAEPNNGHQLVHYDANDAWLAHQKYSVILYTSDHPGIQSTAVPRFPLSHLGFTAKIPPEEELKRNIHLFDKEWYHSVNVGIGDIMIFRESVPHFGVKNSTQQDRTVFFGLLSTSAGKAQDRHQVYRHQIFELAYGDESVEFAQSLLDARHEDPIGRYTSRKHRLRVRNYLRRRKMPDGRTMLAVYNDAQRNRGA